jgi:hypothetical protein
MNTQLVQSAKIPHYCYFRFLSISQVLYGYLSVRYEWRVKDRIVFGEELHPLYRPQTVDMGTVIEG